MLSLGSNLICTGTNLALILMRDWFDPSAWASMNSDGDLCDVQLRLSIWTHHALLEEIPRIALELCNNVFLLIGAVGVDSEPDSAELEFADKSFSDLVSVRQYA